METRGFGIVSSKLLTKFPHQKISLFYAVIATIMFKFPPGFYENREYNSDDNDDMIIALPTFCLCFAVTGLNFRGILRHVCHVAYNENMCGPIRTRKCRSTNLLINCMFMVR